MIFGKIWRAFVAQLNKVANLFWEADPIAQMQYEYDRAVAELKEGRKGLEAYRGMVERVNRQVSTGERHVASLQSKVKAYLKAGDRETAATLAVELQRAKRELQENLDQRVMHEKTYENNLKKIQHANKKLAEVRQKIRQYDAELKMSEAEAEVAALAESFEMNVTTDFGQIEQVLQDRIDKNRGKARVASDLSDKGIAEIEAEERAEVALAEEALLQFEEELGLRSPETSAVTESKKELGPATTDQSS